MKEKKQKWKKNKEKEIEKRKKSVEKNDEDDHLENNNTGNNIKKTCLSEDASIVVSGFPEV